MLLVLFFVLLKNADSFVSLFEEGDDVDERGELEVDESIEDDGEDDEELESLQLKLLNPIMFELVLFNNFVS